MMDAAVLQTKRRPQKARTNGVFITDCEGPISKNDNAFELTRHFIPNGSTLFTLISRYDDIQADIIQKPGYKAGDTLKLILPFLRAFGATNRRIEEFSLKNILLVPCARDTLRFIRNIMPSFMISTSYRQYVQGLCNTVGFPFENTYCTELDLDKYKIGEEETKELKRLKEEIVALPMVEIAESTVSINDFSESDCHTIARLDEIFWKEILGMESGKMLREVNPIGGHEKAKAVKEIGARTDRSLCDCMYVGDSITDVQSFRMVRKQGGLTVSFNGNRYAVREAEVAVLSQNTIVLSVLADAFSKLGRNTLIQLMADGGASALWKSADPPLSGCTKLYPTGSLKVELITLNNQERLMRESTAFRKTVRGEAIGGLG